MYLKKLEIFGFKSFAQKTSINFNMGVTSIVGPNGCGKTNIVDAIRWCLGEQKSNTLRSDKMENVIFNGTSSKKPMGMAEVSLTIENDKGTLPTEYSEVMITRRIFRSGESEYLLNKNICRLKDITNLFMDTGIGANAYSVIELKMVETILNNKTDERRNLFEEAAGVNKYKLRRRLAFRKLDDVKIDLSRVNDIISEVEKKVNSLGRQAKKAEKHTNISSTLRELAIDFSERQLAIFSKQKEEIAIKKELNFKKKLAIESDISRITDELTNVKKSLEETESILEGKRKEISTVTEKIFFSQKQLSVAEERSGLLSDNVDKFHQDIEELNNQINKNQQFIEENKFKIVEFTDLISEKENEKDDATKNVENSSLLLADKGKELKEKSENLLSLYKKINIKENDFSNVGKSLEIKNNSINSSNERIQNLTNTIAKTVGFIEQLQNDNTEAKKNLEQAELDYTREQEKKDQLEAKLNSLKNDELERKSLINSMKDKISFMQSLIDNLDGVSKGTKALINNGEWTKKEKNLLAQIGTSEEKYRLAVEASLRNNLNNILIDSIDELKNAIDYLKSNSAGRAAFYVSRLNDGKNDDFWVKLNNFASKRRIKKLQKTQGFIGWSKDYIKSDKKWRLLFDRILFNTAIVDSIDTMLNLSSDYKEFNFVTLDGDFLDTSGLVESGSAIKADDSLFGRMQLLEDLRKNFPEEEIKLNELREEIEKIEDELSEIDLKRHSDKARLLVNDLANVGKQISQFEYEKEKAGDEIESSRNDIKNLAQESNNLDQNKIELEAELKNFNEEKEEQEKLKDNLEIEYKELEKNYNEAVESKNRFNIEFERLISERKNIENAINRAKSALETIDSSIIKRESDISESKNEKSLLYHKIENSRNEAEENENRKAKLLEEEKEIYERFKLIQSNIREQEESQDSFRKEKEILTDEIHKLDLQVNELRIRITNLISEIKGDYSISLEKKEFDDLESFDFKERENKVFDLKQNIKNLGPINLLAYSEYEEEKERFDFLSNQRNDLINSEKDLLKSIEEINVTAQSLFIETFEKIRTNFIKVFGSLFNPGDEADLKLEENVDPLEAKIEIVAKPKGKRPTSIELLSGGEKTLTAIALLFSIYLVKPSPFCILDEIDAPLDDANIDRFNKIIVDFSESTQFIVVTHNKRTMEAADTLYGVTMQDEGVSKLVSVRFNEDFDFVAS